MIKLVKEIWAAIAKPDSYRDLMNRKSSHLFGYGAFFILICLLLTSIPFSMTFVREGGFGGMIDNYLPEFTITEADGLSIDKPVTIDRNGTYFQMTSEDYEDITSINGKSINYDTVIVFDKNEFYVNIPSMGYSDVTMTYAQVAETYKSSSMAGLYKINSISKDFCMLMVPSLYMMLIITCVIQYIISVGLFFLEAWVLSSFGMIMALYLKIKLNRHQIYAMSLFAFTMPELISVAVALFRINVPGYFLFGFFLAGVYLFYAMKDYKEHLNMSLGAEKHGFTQYR